MLSFTPFRIDPTTQTLWEDERRVHIRAKAFLVLRYLIESAPRVVTRDELLAAVWERTSVGEGLLRGYIRELRHILRDDARSPRYIETLAGRGYRFAADVTVSPAGSTGDAASAPSPPSPQREHVSTSVGRDREIAILAQWLAASDPQASSLLLVSGEAGSGKTTVLDAALDRIGTGVGPIIARGQCIESHGSAEPYQPVLAALQRLCRRPANRHIVDVLARFAPMWLLEMSGVLPEAELEMLRRRTTGAVRERMVRELAEALEALGRERPVILAIDDLHWSDPATIDLLSFLVRHHQPTQVQIVGTYRAALAERHPLRDAIAELKAHGRCSELALGPLDVQAVAEYVAMRFPANAFPPGFAATLHRNTNGIPLFMTALVEGLVQEGSFVEVDGTWRTLVTNEALVNRTPERLVHLIERTLERLSSVERRVLEASSVAGERFAVPAVAAALEMSPDDVEDACELLCRRQQLLERGGVSTWPDGTRASSYAFVRAIHRRVALQRVPPVRRELWHRRIAELLERAFGERVDEVSPELAEHFEAGGNVGRAPRYRASGAALGDLGRAGPTHRAPRPQSGIGAEHPSKSSYVR